MTLIFFILRGMGDGKFDAIDHFILAVISIVLGVVLIAEVFNKENKNANKPVLFILGLIMFYSVTIFIDACFK
jgi:uncharacterized membrane protein YoaK (UPF0700 family)